MRLQVSQVIVDNHKEFIAPAHDLLEAKVIMGVIADYTNWLVEEGLLPDVSTCASLEVDKENAFRLETWEDENGNSIDDYQIAITEKGTRALVLENA